MNCLLDFDELAEHFEVPNTWLRKEFEEGRIPHLNAGGKMLFNPLIVAEALAARATKCIKERGSDE